MFGFFAKLNSDKEAAAALVSKLVLNFPPISLKAEGKSSSVNRVTRLLERTYDAAKQYQSEEAMGMFRRAKFANAFRWQLMSAGYTEEFSKVATEGLVIALMKIDKKKSA